MLMRYILSSALALSPVLAAASPVTRTPIAYQRRSNLVLVRAERGGVYGYQECEPLFETRQDNLHSAVNRTGTKCHDLSQGRFPVSDRAAADEVSRQFALMLEFQIQRERNSNSFWAATLGTGGLASAVWLAHDLDTTVKAGSLKTKFGAPKMLGKGALALGLIPVSLYALTKAGRASSGTYRSELTGQREINLEAPVGQVPGLRYSTYEHLRDAIAAAADRAFAKITSLGYH